MAQPIKARFRKTGDKITMVNRKMWEKEINAMFKEDCDFIGEFRAPKKIRTNLQNSFYFGVFIFEQIDCFKERWGEILSPSQVHDWNKSNVWCKEVVVGDEIIRIPDSSANKTTVEWEERLEQCRQFFMINFDWPLPFPNSQTEIKLI